MRHNLTAPTARGFTLVEVMIAVAILATLTALVWGTIANVFNTRDYFEARNERTQIVRMAMDRMAMELSSAYMAGPDHGGEVIPGQEPPPPTDEEEAQRRLLAREPIQFGFIGKEDSVNFTSFAYVRTQEGERRGHHAEIGYSIRTRVDEATGERARQLVRREDPTYDDDITRGGALYVVVPEIERISFEYWDPGEVRIGTMEELADGRWVRDWDTTRREHAGRLPTRVRITMTIPPQGERGDAETFVTQTQLAITEVLEF